MVDITKAIEQSGEDNIKIPTRSNYPILKFNGKTSIFSIIKIDEETNEKKVYDIGDSTEVVILKVRRILNYFTKDDSFYTNEHDSRKDIIVLFHKDKTGKRTKLSNGTEEELKKEYPLLKIRQVLYVLAGDNNGEEKIMKFNVKGASLSKLWNYFQEKDSHIFEILTSIKSEEESNDMGSYYVMNFENKEKISEDKLEKVVKDIDTIVNEINEMEKHYAIGNQEAKNLAEGGIPKDDIDTQELFPEVEEGEETPPGGYEKTRETLNEEEQEAIKDL